MRHTRVLMLGALAVILFSLNAVAGVPDSIAYQGRLTDNADNPVPDGPRDLILSVWTDSVGGTMLHSEVVVVTVSKGLFSTCIGCGSDTFADVFTGQPRYLQTQLAGQAPMVPRIRLGRAPYSISSSSVHGEATSGSARGRGIISVKSPSGSGSMQGLIYLGTDSDGDGHPEFLVTDSVTTTGATRVIGGDLDGDGVADRRVSNDCDDTDAGISIDEPGVHFSISTSPDSTVVTNERTYLDGKNVIHRDLAARQLMAGTTSVIGSGGSKRVLATQVDSVASSMQFSVDADGDGLDETSVASKVKRRSGSIIILDNDGADVKRTSISVDSAESSISATADLDGDGLAECASSSSSNDSSSHVGTTCRFGSGPRQTTSMDGTFSHAAMRCETDSDNDGLAENSVTSSSTSSRAALAIKTKGTGAQRFSGGGDCDDTDADIWVDADSDGDGIPESSVHSTSSTSSAVTQLNHHGSSTSSNQRITGDCDDTDASFTISADADGDGHNERWIVDAAGPVVSRRIYAADLDADGLADRTITEDCDDTDASIAIDESGVHVAMTSGGASGAAEISIDEPGVHVAVARKGWDGTIKGNFHIEDGGARTVNFDGDGAGYVSKRFGIGSTDPTNPLSLASGAHCTPGGVWTNASDVNLKENFQPVDGEQILDKIEQLPISEWNYKNESDEVKHIGPTAQDFKAAFGVGDNDKTISTIDPSGIALAAIKQLKKENNELKKQVQQLQSLKAEVEQLKQLLSEKK